MYAIRSIPLVLALSLVVRMTPIGLAAPAPAVQPSSTPSEHWHDTSAPLHGQDRHGPWLRCL